MNQIVKIFVAINIILVFIGIFTIGQYKNFLNKPLIESEQTIIIKSGDTFHNLNKKVKNMNALWLKMYLKYNKPHFELKAGKYKLKKDSNLKDIIKSLEKPILDQMQITILEGWNIYDIDEYLLTQELIQNKNDYVQYVTNKEKIEKLSKFFPFINNLESLEGFLYPDTYMVKTNFKINEFVIQQLNTFEKKAYNTVLKQKKYPLSTLYDVVTLASIVEKEEKHPEYRPVVAGILKKRLREGWMLGADITVCYPYRLTSEECKMVVSKYIYEKNEYNTRTKYGLPKTPIGNPSFNSIYATVNDKQSPYYYYLHDIRTGQIYYGKTHAEHIANKKYMR